jgi:hypothetical protein
MPFGTGSGSIFVRSAHAQAQAYFTTLGVLVGEQAAVAQKFGFPTHLVDGTYRFTDTPYLLALVTQVDAPPAVLAFGPKGGSDWPALTLNPNGSYTVAGAVSAADFGVIELAFPRPVVGNPQYLAKLDGTPFSAFDPAMVAPVYVIVSIDSSHVASTFRDGAIVDVSASLAEVQVSGGPNDPGALLALQIQGAIDALQNSCADFHHMGKISDYSAMLAQLQIASQNINLNLASDLDLVAYKHDLDAINAILSQVTLTITQTVTIDDSTALAGILTFIQSLESCKRAVQNFRVAIASVAVINVPKSLSDTATSLLNFNSEVKCIADHLKYFATGVRSELIEPQADYDLSAARSAEIAAAISSVNALASIGSADLNNIEAQAVKAFQDQAKALAANVSSFDSVLSSLAASLSQYLPPAALTAANAAVLASQAAAQARALRNLP